jgi:RNA polymerase sigma-70 factor (ECF subfamily)
MISRRPSSGRIVTAVQDLTERELVARAGEGDLRAIEEIYRRHRGWVTSLALRFTGRREDALDVLQEAFTHLLRQLPAFTLTSTLRAYFFPVVKHLSVDVARRRAQATSLDPAQHDGAVEWRPPDTDVGRMVATLPEAQREVLLMRFELGMRLEEIAQSLAIPLGTVKSRLHLALKALRELHEPGPRPE